MCAWERVWWWCFYAWGFLCIGDIQVLVLTYVLGVSMSSLFCFVPGFVWVVAFLVVTILFSCVSLVPLTVGRFCTVNMSNVHCVWLVLYAVLHCSLWGTLLCCCRDRITCCLLSTVRVYVITLHVRVRGVSVGGWEFHQLWLGFSKASKILFGVMLNSSFKWLLIENSL